MSGDSGRSYAGRLDDAARAGWLYYVGGYKQDDIARSMGISRQTAQRLIAMAVREKLIRIRLDHPIMRCMDLGERLVQTFGLDRCEVVPSTPDAPFASVGLAQAGAAAMERELAPSARRIVAVGTGRALRASVEELVPMNRPDHLIVALLGHMKTGGLSTPFNVVVRMADRINAGHYPMPLPIYARNARERELFHMLDPVRQILQLSQKADVTFVGIGNVARGGPLHADGFISDAEIARYVETGAVGEITGWMFDGRGQLLGGSANERVTSAPLRAARADRPIYGIAAGEAKAPAIRAAMRGGHINRLITNEKTAETILATAFDDAA